MKKISDFPEVVAKREALAVVTNEIAKVEGERHKLLSAEVDTARDDISSKALRFLAGKGLDARPMLDNRQKRLGELGQRGKILTTAQEIVAAELAVAEQAASAEIMEAAGGDLVRLAQELATSLSDVGQKTKAFTDFRTDLKDDGINVDAKFPAIALGRLDLLDRGSWLNRVLTDLESDYSVTISRDVLEEKERDVERFNAAEAKRSQMGGNGYGAGPKGIFRWLPGGKKQVLHSPDDVHHGGVLIRNQA